MKRRDGFTTRSPAYCGWVCGGRRRCGAAASGEASAVAALLTVTFALSRSRSAPSITTNCPTFRPEVTAVLSPVDRPDLDRLHRNRVILVHHVDIGAGCATLHRRRRHDGGVAQRVHAAARALTNWLGNSALSGFSKSARSFTVDAGCGAGVCRSRACRCGRSCRAIAECAVAV